MKNRIFASALLTGLLALSGAASAAQTVLTVELAGPGGHSNGDYGNVNAVHAGARAVMEIQKAVPAAVITDMKGGVSVNAIAGDCRFTVILTGDEARVQADAAKVRAAVQKGADAENAFRGVKAGDLVEGVPAHIRVTVR